MKQVANFYNNLGDEIIDSQYLMLETRATELEAAIKNPKRTTTEGTTSRTAVTWDNPAELEYYATKLQQVSYFFSLCFCVCVIFSSPSFVLSLLHNFFLLT